MPKPITAHTYFNSGGFPTQWLPGKTQANDDHQPLHEATLNNDGIRRSKRKAQYLETTEARGPKIARVVDDAANEHQWRGLSFGSDGSLPQSFGKGLASQTPMTIRSAVTGSHNIQSSLSSKSALSTRAASLNKRTSFDTWIKSHRLRDVAQSEDKRSNQDKKRQTEDIKWAKESIAQDKNAKAGATPTLLRDVFYELGGWRTANDAHPTQIDANGRPIFWMMDIQGRRLLTPAWDLGFDANWNEWGAEFVARFRELSRQHVFVKHLAKESTRRIRRLLKNGEWDAFSAAVKAYTEEPQELADRGDMIVLDNSLRPEKILESSSLNIKLRPISSASSSSTDSPSMPYGSFLTLESDSPYCGFFSPPTHIDPRLLTRPLANATRRSQAMKPKAGKKIISLEADEKLLLPGNWAYSQPDEV